MWSDIETSKDFVDSKEKQIYAFRYVLSLIKDKNKIVSVHSRKAEKEVFELLQEYRRKNAIFHWYSGPLSLIEEIINAGYYFSINEAMTTSISGKKNYKQNSSKSNINRNRRSIL